MEPPSVVSVVDFDDRVIPAGINPNDIEQHQQQPSLAVSVDCVVDLDTRLIPIRQDNAVPVVNVDVQLQPTKSGIQNNALSDENSTTYVSVVDLDTNVIPVEKMMSLKIDIKDASADKKSATAGAKDRDANNSVSGMTEMTEDEGSFIGSLGSERAPLFRRMLRMFKN